MTSNLAESIPEVFHDALFRPVEKCVMHKSGLFCVLYDFDGPSICHVQSGKELIGYAPDRLILSIIEKFCEISDCFEHLSLDDKFQPIWSDDRARETVMSLINRINLEIEIDGLQSDLHRHEEDKASAEDEIQETLREIEKLNAEKEALLKPLEAGGAKQ